MSAPPPCSDINLFNDSERIIDLDTKVRGHDSIPIDSCTGNRAPSSAGGRKVDMIR